MLILKFCEFTTACMIMWSAHVPSLDIFCKYCTHDWSVLLSIKCSGQLIKCWIARARICAWWVCVVKLMAYTAKKNQFPSPVIFTGIHPIWASLALSSDIGLAGPGFNSISPHINTEHWSNIFRLHMLPLLVFNILVLFDWKLFLFFVIIPLTMFMATTTRAR